jgi:hypothetical protein
VQKRHSALQVSRFFSTQGDSMNATWKTRLPLAVLAGLVLIALVVLARAQPVRAERDGAAAMFPRYNVIETQAINLIVTDNQTNILYYYTIDKDQPIGSDLKLRGSLDLNKVGELVLKPKKTAP